jgi:hypothetical protein
MNAPVLLRSPDSAVGLDSPATVTRKRKKVRITDVIAYWRQHAPEVFPDIHASFIGWGEPFCFRCGWLAPLPEEITKSPWVAVGGWLELAHLHDHCAGGPDKPANLVPLCARCHRAMPEFKDGPEAAIAWVRDPQPISCPWWWQAATDGRWGDVRFVRYPGWAALHRLFVRAHELVERHYEAVKDAERAA